MRAPAQRFIVVGLGHFGSWAARTLYAQGHEVVAVDKQERLVDRFGNDVTRAVAGDATEPGLLEEIYVKVTSGEAARALETLGVRETIFPEREVADRLAHRIVSTTVLDYMPLTDVHSVQEIAVPDAWLGKTLRELALPRDHGIQVVAIYDLSTEAMEVVPDPDEPLKESNVAIVAGHDEDIAEVFGEL